MTHFNINGFTVNGIDDTPFLSMNVLPKVERTPQELARIERYKTLSLMNAMTNKLDLGGLNREEVQEIFEGVKVIEGAITEEIDALVSRFNSNKSMVI